MSTSTSKRGGEFVTKDRSFYNKISPFKIEYSIFGHSGFKSLEYYKTTKSQSKSFLAGMSNYCGQCN